MLNSVKLSVGDLETAVKVAECRNFTRADETMHITQTAVTKGVRRIEHSLELELFDRHVRPPAPTRSGEVFSYQMRKALFFIERAIVKGKQASQSPAVPLQVGHTSYFDLDLLTRLLTMGNQLRAEFCTVFHSSSTAEIVANVLAGVWSCGFIINPAEARGLRSVPVANDSLGLVMPKNHPLVRKRFLQLTDIASLPLIVPSRERNPGFRNWFLYKCGEAGIKPQIVHEVSNPHEGSVLASQELGHALTPSSSARHLSRGPFVFRPFARGLMDIQMQLVLPKKEPSNALKTFERAVVKISRLHSGVSNSSKDGS
jgi:DNA-binding transcriptional LysR family regulator